MNSQKQIVVIGGGTGSFSLLQDLKKSYKHISAIVNMADNGGSTGLLRDEFGVLPPGDVRQCLVALSDAPEQLRELFNFRFPKNSSFSGHSFGNLFLSTVEMMTSDFNESVKMAQQVLQIRSLVIPVTLTSCNLVLNKNGKILKGEKAIGIEGFNGDKKPNLHLSPSPKINYLAESVIKKADLIVIAPGNLYRSLAPTLLVDGVGKSIRESNAKVVAVSNLVNKLNETDNFTVDDYISEIERFIGGPRVDVVLYNDTLPDKRLVKIYERKGEFLVNLKNPKKKRRYKLLGGNFISNKPFRQNPDDVLTKRSLIRHDGKLVAQALMRLR